MLKTPHSFTPLMDPKPSSNPLSFIFHEGKLLVRAEDLALPDAALTDALKDGTGGMQPLGMFDGRYCQTTWATSESVAPAGYEWRGLRSLFGGWDEDLLGLAGRASQVAEWARTHRFCGACGSAMEKVMGERCFKCASCGMTAYPRISPAMMVLIRKGDAYLMAMHKFSPSKRFTPLAGFLEAGESIEEAVHREVFEEVGLRVRNLKYFASQSWPFPHSLMIAFTADYLDGEIRIDANELSEARWFGPDDEWPERVPHISVSSILVDAHRPGN
ncbi:NAD(+) diphosphatase [Massilia cavernae]|uniref:NAD(+) diphosphatase n=1 Tax=Massilia cavernae TaxID=2320864 RepID=A0A418XTV6_9BURK|nr:NAD(+) diphosphatase [Massilia cavernae]RJG16086.1 NAD(+) diphosphatase [Massilia cavernae]